MSRISDLLFQARMLKAIPRSGFGFLGAGRESVADHSFSAAFIAFVMSRMQPQVDALRLISMSLVHDLTEARIGDLNSVQKEYVTADEAKALDDTVSEIPFGEFLAELIDTRSGNVVWVGDAETLVPRTVSDSAILRETIRRIAD